MVIPELETTCFKLFQWAQPLLSEKEQDITKGVISQFLEPNGEGEALQNALIQWNAQAAVDNWSAPVWKDLYLASRHSLVINSNVFYYLKSKRDEHTESQARIASALISCVYRFIDLVDSKSLSVDTQKGTPLCMSQYEHIFSSVRIPRKETDEFKAYSTREHIVVMHGGRLFKVIILNESGDLRSPRELEADLASILTCTDLGQNVGLFTTIPREHWATCRTELVELSSQNRQSMDDIEQAAFALCLDKNKPQEISKISQSLLHGSGTDRFFDKSLQFIVFANGKTGINFEHTSVDGSVMLRMIAHIYDTIADVDFGSANTASNQSRSNSKDLQEITFELSDSLTKTLSDAVPAFVNHVDNTQTRVIDFSSFGKSLIKQFKVSPDAFVQLALQLAEYKLYGKCYSAYEAVMTRTFLDGRIDVLYTVTPESLSFIQQFCSQKTDKTTLQQALRTATQKHTQRANECRMGEGVYTHMLALQYMQKQVGQRIGINAMPTIFSDKGYRSLTQSVVCTSTTSEYGVELAGYGPIVDNGYGIRYFIRDNAICFNMTSRTALRENLDKMKIYIEQSLLEMAELMQRD
jgi:carnitine O-acetyltransferase